MVRPCRTHYKSCNKQGASPGSSCMPYPITYIGSLMKVLLSRPVASIVLVHDRTRNKLNSISERTSLVTVQRSAQGRVTSGCPTIGLCDRARYFTARSL